MRAHQGGAGDQMIYLDWAASAPPEPEAIEAVREVSLALFANPSSPTAREERRESGWSRCAAALPGPWGSIRARSSSPPVAPSPTAHSCFLCSIATAGRRAKTKARIVTTAIEHASVYEQAKSLHGHGIACTVVAPRPDGIVDPQAIADALDEDTLLVSVMLVNNETGAMQNLAEISRAVRDPRSVEEKSSCTPMPSRLLERFPSPCASSASMLPPSAATRSAACGESGPSTCAAAPPRASLPRAAGRRRVEGPGLENLPGHCALTVAAEKRLAAIEENLRIAGENARRLIARAAVNRGALGDSHGTAQ